MTENDTVLLDLDVDGITEELLRESAIYRADDDEECEVVNNTMDDDEDDDDEDDGPECWDEDGSQDEVSSLQFFMAMEKVPTSTGQEKGYRVLPNGYSHVNGVKKPRFRVITFDKPAAAQAREMLMASLNSELRKWADRNGYVLNYGKDRMGGVAGSGAGVITGGVKGSGAGIEVGRKAGGRVTLKRERRIVQVPLFPKGVPLSLTVKWCFGNDAVMTGKIPDGTPRTTKPDTDNLDKMLKDCMTRAGIWWDDAQVTEEHIGKYWSRTPGIWVRVVRIRL